MSDLAYTKEQLDSAVEAISDPQRLEQAQQLIATAMPDLQNILSEALQQGGWFSEAHQAEILKAVGEPDIDERQVTVSNLIAEEIRLGMMVGVAVGYELAKELET